MRIYIFDKKCRELIRRECKEALKLKKNKWIDKEMHKEGKNHAKITSGTDLKVNQV